VAVRLRCGGAPVSEGRRRQPLEYHHGMGVLEDLRMGQEGVVRELLMVNCGGEIEEEVDGTYRWQNGRRLGWTRGRGSLKKRCTHGGTTVKVLGHTCSVGHRSGLQTRVIERGKQLTLSGWAGVLGWGSSRSGQAFVGT
jgi:hypothetical protein